MVLRRWRRALAHTNMGLALSWLLRRVRALRLWVAGLRVARAYLRTLRPLHRRVVQRKRAVLLYLPYISQARGAAAAPTPHP